MDIVIAGKIYEIKDVLSNITIADSAVAKNHKTGSGRGERKIYLCGNVQERLSFFDDFRTEAEGFVWKENLLDYLENAKGEYQNPSYEYRDKDNMPMEYDELVQALHEKDDILSFKVKKSDVEHSGIYINQDSGKRTDKNWNLIGDIALPRVSRLSIIKISDGKKTKYYFKVGFGTVDLDDTEKEAITEKNIKEISNSKLEPAEKEMLILARIGQGSYRRRLLKETSICPFTLVDDERLLIASHIKPWNESANNEKKDAKNGFVFTPTYDKLFDKGYISFTDDKRLIVSPWLSKYNCARLGLVEGMLVDRLPSIDDKRKKYLEYHRAYILKKLEDL